MSSATAPSTTIDFCPPSAIRVASHADFPGIFGLAEAAFADGHLGRFPPQRDAVYHTLRAMEHSAAYLLLVAEQRGELVGVLGGAIQPMFHTRKKYATDAFFYCRRHTPGAGLKLARRFIAWAKEHRGVREIFMASSSPAVDHSLQDRLYTHLGFTPLGRVFRMEVSIV